MGARGSDTKMGPKDKAGKQTNKQTKKKNTTQLNETMKMKKKLW